MRAGKQKKPPPQRTGQKEKFPMTELTGAPTGRNGGDFEKFKEQWHLQIAADKSLPAGALRVASAIASHMNRRKNGLAWPGFNRLAKLTRLSRRTIIRATKALEQAGHMTITRRKMGTENSPNEYRPVLKESVQNDTTLVSRMTPPSVTHDTTPSVTGDTLTSELEPLSEPLNEPLPYKASTAPERNIQIKRVAEEERKIENGEDGDSLNPIDQPSHRVFPTPGFVPRASATSTTTPTHLTYQEAQALGLGPPAPRFKKNPARW
jgi:DNA-binding transcriptional regulator YhcF (GntR family)